jgi:hypothetical protein
MLRNRTARPLFFWEGASDRLLSLASLPRGGPASVSYSAPQSFGGLFVGFVPGDFCVDSWVRFFTLGGEPRTAQSQPFQNR